ncbi:MAG: Uma2 family endonuclease [Stackebrandtia sp.]
MATIDVPMHDLTVDDLERLPDEYRYELHEGNLLIMSPATVWHYRVGARLVRVLERKGKSVSGEVGIRLGNRSFRVADAAVFAGEVDDTRAYFGPDEILVAVEIVSPSSEDDDHVDKPRRYARAGIPEYWRIERAEDAQDAVIYMFKLARTADGDAAYVDNGITTLSNLEAQS